MNKNNTSLRTSKRSSGYWWNNRFLRVVGIGMAIILCASILQIEQFGQMAIIAYGIIALILGIQSSETFRIAVISLALIPVLFFIGNDLLAHAFSTYGWLLLAIAGIHSIVESWALQKRGESRKISYKTEVKSS